MNSDDIMRTGERRADSDILLPGEKAVPVGNLINVIDNGHGLCWGTDAYLLAAFMRRHKRACELGSGCGVISFLAAAHKKAESIIALELNEDAANRTARGIILNGLEDRVRLIRRDIREVRHDDKDIGGRFDCVFSNPPYIAHPGKSSADRAADDARHENNGSIADFCAAASRLLNYKGSFYVVFRPERMADLFAALRASRLEPKHGVLVYPDAESKPSLLLCEAVLGAAPGFELLPPLFFYRDTKEITPRRMTERMEKIYSECGF